MQKRTLNGETYLSSKSLLDIIYDSLTEEVPDPPKSLNEAIALAGFKAAGANSIALVDRASYNKLFQLFPNYKSFEQAIRYDGYKSIHPIVAQYAWDYYFGVDAEF